MGHAYLLRVVQRCRWWRDVPSLILADEPSGGWWGRCETGSSVHILGRLGSRGRLLKACGPCPWHHVSLPGGPLLIRFSVPQNRLLPAHLQTYRNFFYCCCGRLISSQKNISSIGENNRQNSLRHNMSQILRTYKNRNLSTLLNTSKILRWISQILTH